MANYGYTPGAYNPYNPAGSYGYPSPFNTPFNTGYTPALTGQQTPPQVPQNASQAQSNVPWIQVPNIEAARNVMVQPNQTAYMMNQNAPEFYVKATDGMGVATIKYFRFQEFSPEEEAVKQAVNSQSASFVSRDEFNQFANAINAQFNAIQQNMVVPTPVAVQPIVPQVQSESAPAPVRGVSKKKEATNDGQ